MIKALLNAKDERIEMAKCDHMLLKLTNRIVIVFDIIKLRQWL